MMNIRGKLEIYNFEERIVCVPSIGYTIFYGLPCVDIGRYMDTDNFILPVTIRNEIEFHMDILNEIIE